MTILERLTTDLTALALREARDLAGDGYSETDVREVVTANNTLRVDGAVLALQAYLEARERALGIVRTP